ncbi:MAG: bifunctional phosphoribosyl-AMP cyclohydrolase/phosphoribosyl-ATP diphosphatase HisIE [Patescibacteria group bacterium]
MNTVKNAKKNVLKPVQVNISHGVDKLNTERLDFEKLSGIIPAIIQDADTKLVLMLGFMNKDALNKTIKNRKVTFWSRTKKRLWEKGKSSGNTLKVLSIATDCDHDTLLILTKPQGPVCHTGAYSCFGVKKQERSDFLKELYDLIATRKKELPIRSYTTSLFNQGLGKILKKVKEESGEVIQAAKKESKTRLIEESADLVYHLWVLLAEKNISICDLLTELKRRRKGG